MAYEEWRGRRIHLRIALRGNGAYAIELDGMSGWNRHLARASVRRLRRQDGLLSGRLSGGAMALFAGLRCTAGRGPLTGTGTQAGAAIRSCVGPPTGFYATLEVVAEFSGLQIGRARWTHPGCFGYPAALARALWGIVHRVSRGAITRPELDYGRFPPPGAAKVKRSR